MKTTTKKQVVEMLTDLLVGNEKAPSSIRVKLLDKLEGVAFGKDALEITFDEGKSFFTNVRIMVGDVELFECEKEDEP